jgi:hypothetical protein
VTDAVARAEGWPARLERLRARAPLITLGIVVLIAYALVVPRMGAEGTARGATLDLDEGQPLPGLRKSRATIRNQYGFVVSSYGSAKVSFAIPPTFPVEGERTILRISAGGPDVSTEVSLIDGAGSRHLLGRPEHWQAHRASSSPRRTPGMPSGCLRIRSWDRAIRRGRSRGRAGGRSAA